MALPDDILRDLRDVAPSPQRTDRPMDSFNPQQVQQTTEAKQRATVEVRSQKSPGIQNRVLNSIAGRSCRVGVIHEYQFEGDPPITSGPDWFLWFKDGLCVNEADWEGGEDVTFVEYDTDALDTYAP